MTPISILLIDDDASVTGLLIHTLKRDGHKVSAVGSLSLAYAHLETHTPEIVLLDHQLPDGNALDFLRWAREKDNKARIVVLTAHGSIPLAVEAIKTGAEQFLTKPVELDSLRVLLEKLAERNRETRRDLAMRYVEGKNRTNPFLGQSEAMKRVEEVARSVARSSVPIFIRGETGSGKGVLARWLHQASDRSEESFVDLNCAGLSRELVESELFGHKKGAFTGATADKMGLLELADRGTLFLDEIGDLDMAVQPKLLKALEDHTFRRLGAVQERNVDVRLITATHKDLAELAAQGAFRNDLLFRINTVTIELPPLRDRPEDIVPLAREILTSLGMRGTGSARLRPEAEQALIDHDWPGNARELKNELERALLFSPAGDISPSSLMLGQRLARTPQDGINSKGSLADAERQHVITVLRSHAGDVPLAAQALGVPRSSLYAKLKRWGVRPRDL
jgi:DNA-binding NtrC family response regulator